jgi:tetratricopeptide (TPR) repeat protein
MEFSIFGLLNSPEFQLLISMFLVPLAVNSVNERLKALKAAIKGKTHEEQLLDCLEKAFFETERTLGWKHDTEAIYETFMGSLMSFSSTFNKDVLAEIFKDAIGVDVTDNEISLWVDNLLKQITRDEHNELFKYFLLNNIIVDKPSPQPQVTLNYLLTYTTPVWDNKDVICRDDIIQELFAKFSNGVRRIQVAGMGGLGKSEILVKLFFQLNQPNPPVQFDYIGFIRFNDDLESNLRSQIPYLTDYAIKNGEKAAKLFLQQLCATKRVLFCIDDNRDKKDVLKKNDPSFEFLKTLNASILFASRTEYNEFEQQDLPLLSTDACIEIFQRIYEPNVQVPRDLEILTKIIEDMSGNNTLIVNRLGNMANENSFTIEKLQKNLQDMGFHIKKDCINEEELQQEINKLYPLSDLTRPGERSIVEAFSIFPVNPLPIDLSVDWLHEDAGIDAEECSRALTRLSRQTWLEKRIDASSGEVLFSMHRCVKFAVRDQAFVEYSAHQRLVKNCRACLDKSTNAYQLQNSSLIIPFAISIFEGVYIETAVTSGLSSAIAKFYNLTAVYSLALVWQQKSLEICENVWGNDHPDTAVNYHNIASIYDTLCQYDPAMELYQKALAIVEKVLGKDHPDTAKTYDNIANMYHKQGKYNFAIELYQKALVAVEKALGKDHPYTASIYHNIASVYNSQGKYALALKWHRQALVILEKKLGKDHPDTATTYNSIANVSFELGKYDLALKWHRKALVILEKTLGKDHPETAGIYSNIARIYHRQGQYDLALEWYQKTMMIYEKTLGKDHQFTADTYNGISGVYMSQGQYDLALEWCKKALAICENILGKDHPSTAVTYSNIASCYSLQGRYDLALEWYRKDLAISEIVFGEYHPSTAATYNNIAIIYYNQLRFKQALMWFRKSLTIRENKLGKDHPDTVATKEAVESTKKLISYLSTL